MSKKSICFGCIVIVLLLSIFLVYQFIGKGSIEPVTQSDVNNIKLNLLSTHENDGNIAYSVELSNESDRILVHNEISLSYPIISGNSEKQSTLVTLPERTKLNIKPNEKYTLNFIVPKYIIKDEHINASVINMKLVGYFDKILEETRFIRISDINSFK